MILRDGKFYNSDGRVVPLEFGNKEQLSILDKVAALKEGIMILDAFHCLCGMSIQWPEHLGEKSDDEFKDIICGHCAVGYRFFIWDGEVPCIKLIDSKRNLNRLKIRSIDH